MPNTLCRSFRSAIVVLLVLVAFSGPRAAAPSSGTVTPSSSTLTFTGGPFLVPNPTGDQGTPVVCLGDVKPCDDFALTVAIPGIDPNVYFLGVSIAFASADADFDLYIYDSAGTALESSTGGAGTQEALVIQAPPGTNSFTVRIVPYTVATGSNGDTYAATVTLTPNVPPPEPPVQPTVPGVPRYENYQAPPSLGNDAGEPTLGANWSTGKVMYIAGLQTLRVGFDDCASPALATWEDKSFATTSRASADPILFTDSLTNRTFVSQLTGACSAAAFTDDDGENWTPSEGCGTPAGADHQTIGGGPFAPDPIGPTTSYPDAVYYCSQSNATSFCALSRDGGLTFGPGVAAWNLTQCGAIHGHIKVAPDGTVYVPNRSCTGTAGVIVSEDNGLTWSVRKVCVGACDGDNDSTPPVAGDLVDPSVGIGSSGRVYFGYQKSDGHPWIAVSDDKGLTWHDNQDVGVAFGIKNTSFPAVVAGHNSRAAYAFLGTATEGNYEDPATFHGAWHLYIAHTFDGGVTWTTVDATPNDPVQRGSICNMGTLDCANVPDDRNLLDFMDITMDAVGRVLVAYADGCITNTCIQGGVNDFTAKATIARQSGGKRLLPQYDPHPAEPGPPQAPLLAAFRAAAGVVHLSWSKPDNGGSDITGYRIHRGLTSGGETFLTSVGTRNSYHDITAQPGMAYFYRITAQNAAGEGAFCNEVFVPAGVNLPPDPCSLPGVPVSQDNSDALPNAPPTPAVDIQRVYAAEPFFADNSSKLVFRLQVGTSASAPPSSSQWYILWNRTTPDANADRNYVAMKTDVAGVLHFEYGRISPPNANLPTRVGDADSGDYDAAKGEITITISTSLVDNIGAGQTLNGLHARTFFSRADGLPVTQTASSDFSPDGVYNLVGNASCRSNAAPTSNLVPTVAGGCVPLTVSFDASQSTDPDAGDSVATYQFDFGDGSPAAIQSSPFASHIYGENGDYVARLLVTDSRGKMAANVALSEIHVNLPPDDVGILTWTGKNTLSWTAANAASYRVYRGAQGDLPELLGPNVDSCTRTEVAATTTGPVLTEDPGGVPGSLYWYLVAGVNGVCQGPAGDATAGPHVVNSMGACP